jgi:hypothetical protein
MKLLKVIFTIGFLSVFAANAQNSDFIFGEQDYEKQVLEYKPTQREGVTTEKFDYAKMILSETKKDVEKNWRSFNVLNYFNVLSAFLELKEPERNVQIAFNRFKNAAGSCDYVVSFWIKVADNPKYSIIRNAFAEAEKECQSKKIVEVPFNVEDYAKANSLNLNLVKQIIEINENDQLYRSDEDIDWSKQTPLDLKNQQQIEELFKKHKTYIGSKLVGKKYESIMWSVIQHSNLKMGKYLSIVHNAVKANNLDSTPLKMLIDRIYSLKFKYQIFGSQGAGVRLADEKTLNNVKKKYGLN